MNEPAYLRALEATDLDRMHRWHNDRSLYEMIGGPFNFVSRHAAESWLERKTSYSSFSADEISLAICVRDSDKHVGNIYLRQINWISRNAELQIFIGDSEERSKGVGRSAVRQLLAYSFKDLGLYRVYLYVLTDNSAAIKAYERIGFKAEGMLRKHVFKNGVWKDVIAMGICADDEAVC